MAALLLNTLRRDFEVDLPGLPLPVAEDEWFRIYNTTWAMLARRPKGARLKIGHAFLTRSLPDRAFAVPEEP